MPSMLRLVASKLVAALKNVDEIIEQKFSEEIPNHYRGKNYLSYYSVEKYVKRFIKLDIDFLQKSKHPVTLLANELTLKTTLEIDGASYKFGGKADRIEMRGGIPYVIDYKTGAVNPSDLTISDIDELLIEGKYKPKFVQLLMYAWLTSTQLKSDKVVSGIYTLRNSELNLLEAKLAGVTEFGTEEVTQFEEFVIAKVREMLNPDVDLIRNPDYQFGVF